jgi:hypothetical protein
MPGQNQAKIDKILANARAAQRPPDPFAGLGIGGGPMEAPFNPPPPSGGHPGFAPPDAPSQIEPDWRPRLEPPGSRDRSWMPEEWRELAPGGEARPPFQAQALRRNPLDASGMQQAVGNELAAPDFDPAQRDIPLDRASLARLRGQSASERYSPLGPEWGWLDLAAGAATAVGETARDVPQLLSGDPGAIERHGDRREFLARGFDQLGDDVGGFLNQNMLSDAPASDLLGNALRSNRNARFDDVAELERLSAALNERNDPMFSEGEPIEITARQNPLRQAGALVDDFWVQPARDARAARGAYAEADALEEVARDAGFPLVAGDYERQARQAAATEIPLTASGALEFIPGVGLLDLGVSAARTAARQPFRAMGAEIPQVLQPPVRAAPGPLTQEAGRARDGVLLTGAGGVGGYAAGDAMVDDPDLEPWAQGLGAVGGLALARTGARALAPRVAAEGPVRSVTQSAPRAADDAPMGFEGAPRPSGPVIEGEFTEVVPQRNFEAAVRDPETGQTYTGMDHLDAIESAPDDATRARLTAIYDAPTEDPASVGFMVNGQFMSREDGLASMRAATGRPRGVRIGEELDVRSGEIRPASPIDPDAPDVRLGDDLGIDFGTRPPSQGGIFSDQSGRAPRGPDAGASAERTVYLETLRAEGFDVERPFYHGTDRDFDQFDTARAGENYGDRSIGVSLTPNPEEAWRYAGRRGTGAVIRPVYVRYRNPLVFDAPDARTGNETIDTAARRGDIARMLAEAESRGEPYDAIIAQGGPNEEIFQVNILDAANIRQRFGRAPARPDGGASPADNALNAGPVGPGNAPSWDEGIFANAGRRENRFGSARNPENTEQPGGQTGTPQGRAQYHTRNQERNERILALARELGTNRAYDPGVGGAGRRLPNSADAIAARLRDEGFPDLTRSTVLGVLKRERDRIAGSVDEAGLTPEAAARASDEDAAARLGIPVERYRQISARRNDPLAGVTLGLGGLGGAAALGFMEDAEAQDDVADGAIVEMDGLSIDTGAELPSMREASGAPQAFGTEGLYVQEFSDGSRHVFFMDREGDRPEPEYVGALIGVDSSSEGLGRPITEGVLEARMPPLEPYEEEAEDPSAPWMRGLAAVGAGLATRGTLARNGVRGVSRDVPAMITAGGTSTVLGGDPWEAGVSALATPLAAPVLAAGGRVSVDVLDSMLQPGTLSRTQEEALASEPRFMERSRAFALTLPDEAPRARVSSGDDLEAGVFRDLPWETDRLAPRSEFLNASPAEQLDWMNNVGFRDDLAFDPTELTPPSPLADMPLIGWAGREPPDPLASVGDRTYQAGDLGASPDPSRVQRGVEVRRMMAGEGDPPDAITALPTADPLDGVALDDVAPQPRGFRATPDDIMANPERGTLSQPARLRSALASLAEEYGVEVVRGARGGINAKRTAENLARAAAQDQRLANELRRRGYWSALLALGGAVGAEAMHSEGFAATP